MEHILLHIGQRIRLYRKLKGMTMDELAQKLHKSKASISKYESGQISIDIVTMFEIAEVLEINPNHLLDYPSKERNSSINNIFEKTEYLYVYHLHNKTINTSIIKLGISTDNYQETTLFYKIDKEPFLEQCDCVYHGKMYSYTSILSFVLRNYHNPIENILLNFFIPIRKTSLLTGMISGLNVNTLTPISYKVLLSSHPQSNTENLRKLLEIDHELFKEIKRKNAFTISSTDL